MTRCNHHGQSTGEEVTLAYSEKFMLACIGIAVSTLLLIVLGISTWTLTEVVSQGKRQERMDERLSSVSERVTRMENGHEP